MKRPTRTVFILLMLVAIGFLIYWRGHHGPKKVMARPAVPVTVATARTADVPITVAAIGTVQPYDSVSVKSMVAGELTDVHFRDGTFVHKGQLLFRIDPRPYEAALGDAKAKRLQAQATLAKDEANVTLANQQLTRYEALAKAGVISREQLDQVRANQEAALAAANADRSAVAAAAAEVNTAEVNLSYTVIRSPLSGRAGAQLVQAGNVVKANDVPILNINQIEPIYVQFSVPEQYLDEVRRRMGKDGGLAVSAAPQGAGVTETGQVSFVDTAVDPTTGTIMLRASFPNRDHRLWPGQFSQVTLTLRTLRHAVEIPSAAVVNGQQGSFVFVVQPNQTVKQQMIVSGPTQGAMTVIQKGVAAGQVVVTDGQINLLPGSHVAIKSGGAATEMQTS